MVYTKQTWNDNDPATPLNQDRLRHIETQYDEAVEYINSRPTGSGGGGGSLAPVFVETRDTGLVVKTPANLRTGLPTTTYADGGYTDELVIAVTGSKGSKILTATTDASKVVGLGSTPFAAALNSSDGKRNFFVTAVSNDGVSAITLRNPLTADFDGTISAKYDAALGQHLTKAATRAYAQYIAGASGVMGARGRIISGDWELRPALYNDVWALNAASVAYGVSNSAAPIVRTEMSAQGVHNVLHSVDFIEMYPTLTASGMQGGTHKQGHGLEGTIFTGRHDSVLEFYTAAYRSTATSSAGYVVHVKVTGDGTVLLEQDVDGWMNHFTVPTSGFDKIVVSVTNNNVADTPYYVTVSNLTVREAGTAGPVAKGKVVTMGDSWFARYSAEFSQSLAARTGAAVIDHSLSGMTTQWALAWFDTYVLAEKPDEAWFHFFTNDDNQVAGTFVAPDGTNQLLWPAGLTADQSMALWRQNILTLIYRCQKAGIRPVIVMPGGTASEAQTQRHCKWASNLDIPGLIDGWSALGPELTDPTAYVNTVGKHTGTRVLLAGAPKYASGPLPTDPFIDATPFAVRQDLADSALGALSTFRRALSRRDSAPVTIWHIGDSITFGVTPAGPTTRWASILRDRLRRDWPTVGDPTGGFGFKSSSSAQNPDVATTGGTTVAPGGAAQFSPDGFVWRGVQLTDKQVYTFTGTGVDILYFNTPVGDGHAFAYKVDGGALSANIVTDAAYTGPKAAQVRGLSSGVHTIEIDITVASGSASLYAPICGIVAYDGDESKGFRQLTAGVAGTRAADWDVMATGPFEIAKLYAPDLVTLAFGTNDYGGTVPSTPAAYQTALTSMIAKIKARTTGKTPSFVIFFPAEIQKTSPLAPYSQYRAAAYAIAAADPDNVCVYDWGLRVNPLPLFGSSLGGLLYTDFIHPTVAGHLYIAKMLERFLPTGSVSG